jgi:hypothetical protein
MTGFLKGRSLRNAAARNAAAGASPPVPSPSPTPPVEATAAEGAPPAEAGPGSIETALSSAPAASAERYQIRENEDGWSVHDSQTGTTAETYGYRLSRMNRSRAESLVEVLNRGEVRRRGRNG